MRAPRAALLCISMACLSQVGSSRAARAEGPPSVSEPPRVSDTLVVEGEENEPERDQDNAQALETLRRTPGGVALVTDEQIDRTRAFSLEDALEAVPGVYVRSRGTGEEPQLSIRGSGLRSNYHTRGVNVLIDGFPYQNADGFSDVESFELLAARRIEVYKGANSVRFGGSALGGALNIVTETGRAAPRVRLRSEGGSFGFWKSYAQGALEGGPWDGFLALSQTQQDGYRDHAEQDRQRVYTSFGRSLSNGAELRLDLNAVRNRQELPGSLTRDEFDSDPSEANPASQLQDEARDYDYGRGALALSWPVSESLRLEWQNQLNFQDLHHPLAFGVIDNQTWNASSEGRLTSTRPLFGRESLASTGLQLGYTRLPQKIHVNDEGNQGATFARELGQAANVAFYASEDLSLGESVSLVAASRFQWARRAVDDEIANDTESVDYFLASPSLGAIWRYADGSELYGNVGYLVEPAVLFELTAPGNLDGDLDDLDPQRAVQLEIGTRGQLGSRLRFDVSVFDIELWDEIRNVNVDAGGFTVPRFENVSRSRHCGLELGLGLLLARDLAAAVGGSGGGELELETSYTYWRLNFVDDDDFGDNELPGAPEQFAVATLRWRHPSGFWLAPQLEAVPRNWYVDSENEHDAPSYALVNLRAGYDHEGTGLSLFVEARNLGDHDYVSAVVVDDAQGRYYEPGDGRGVYGGMEWRWR